MKRSKERILTTHTGSLPQPSDIVEVLFAEQNGQPFDRHTFERRLPSAVKDIVCRQVESGVDVVDDGEFGKASWSGYVTERLTGLERVPLPSGEDVRLRTKDRVDFADYYRAAARATAIMTLPPDVLERRLSAPPSPGRWS